MNTANKKIMFFDIDGTLVSFDGQMPESTAIALRQAQANGHDIILCTGRCYNQIYDYLLDFGFDGIVAAAGAYVEYKGEEIFHATFGRERLRTIVDCFAGTKTALIFERKKDCIFHEDSEQPFIRAYAEIMALERIKDHSAFHNIFVDNDLETYPERYPDVEGIIYCESPYTTEEVRQRMNETINVETASFHRPEPYSGEITVAGINKGSGIQAILDHVGGKKEDVIAFGDGANDIEMLDYAGFSVVMDNALDSIKEHGDYITAAVDQEGIRLALEHLKLI